MNYKKITAFILTMLLLFQTVGFNIVNAKTTDITKEITVLSKLGIIDIDLENGYDGDKVVTRAEFAAYTARALKVEIVKNKVYFSDVSNDYWASGEINALLERGILDEAKDGKFNPEMPITYEQACKIFVVAAGYKPYAVIENSGVSGYASVAQRMDIDITVKNKSTLVLSEAIQLLYNGMSVNVLVSIDGIESKVDEEKTLFSIYHGIYIGEGNITSVYGAKLQESDMVKKNQAIIDGQTYSVESGCEVEKYFGDYVEYVYLEKGRDDYTLYYIFPLEKKNEEFYLDSEFIDSFNVDNYKIGYYKSKDSASVSYKSIERGAKINYNGKNYDGKFSDIITEFSHGTKKGYIRMLDKNGDSKYEIIIIKSYETFVASNYNMTENLLYNNYDKERQLNLDEYRLLRIYNEYGEETQIPSVMPVVLGVAESQDKEYAEIIVCQNQISGTISEINEEEHEISIDDGDSIKVNKQIWLNQKNIIITGKKVTVTLDNCGYIGYISIKDEEEMRPVYLKKVISKNDVDLKFGISVYEQDNTFQTYYLSKTIKIDGKNYKTEEYKELFKAFPGNVTITDDVEIKVVLERQIIRIKLNNTGEISAIDTGNVGKNEDKKYTLTKKHDGTTSLLWSNALQRFGLNVLYNKANTKIFAVPNVNSDGYIVVNGVQKQETPDMFKNDFTFVHDVYYALETYQYNYDNFYEDIIVVKLEPTYQDETCFMFKNISEAVNSDDEVMKQIEGYANGSIVKYMVDETALTKLEGLKEGDILRIETNSVRDAAVNIVKMFDAETRMFENNNSNIYWYGGIFDINGQWPYRAEKYQLSKSYAYDLKDGIIKSTYDRADLSRGVINEATDANRTNFVIYDSSKRVGKRIREGTLSDVADYTHIGGDCSLMVVNTRFSTLKQIFIYK